MNCYRIKGIRRIVGTGTERDWGYAFNLRVETDDGPLVIGTEKMNCPRDYGFTSGEMAEGKFALFCNRRLIATLAQMVEHEAWPKKGEEVRLLTEVETERVEAELGIPRDERQAEEILGTATEVDYNGNPVPDEE